MKKAFFLLVIFNFIFLVVVSNLNFVSAKEDASQIETINNIWEWEPYGEGVILTDYHGDSVDVYVPNVVKENGEKLPVIKLGDNIFNGNLNIHCVVLGYGIKEIGAGAFKNSTNLGCVATSETLTTIDSNAFEGCSNLNSIILKDTVTTIGADPFNGCDKLTIYVQEGSIIHRYAENNDIAYEIISDSAVVEKCTEDGVEYEISNGEAKVLSYLDENPVMVKIPMAIKNYPVTTIGSNAFYKCLNVSKIVLPSGIKYIGSHAFYGCTDLVEINFPEELTQIDHNAFGECNNLLSAVMNERLLHIGKYAFRNCINLSNLTLPSSLVTIDTGAFESCESLTSVFIPDNVNVIDRAFGGCESLEQIVVSEYNMHYSSDEYGVLFDKGKSKLLRCPANSMTTSYSVPQSVVTIDDFSFSGCENIITVIIPESVISIGGSAFRYCYNIQNIIVSEQNQQYSSDGFGVLFNKDKSNLIFYPSGNDRINYTIIDSVEEISDDAFYNCRNLTEIFVSEANMHYSSDEYGVLFDKNKTKLIQYPIGNSRISYIIPDGVTTIGETACKFSSFSRIVMPDSVKNIEVNAFSNCKRLKHLYLSKSIEKIQLFAFFECNSLTDVYFPGNEENWQDIKILNNNDGISKALIHYDFKKENYDCHVLACGYFNNLYTITANIRNNTNLGIEGIIIISIYDEKDRFKTLKTLPVNILADDSIDVNLQLENYEKETGDRMKLFLWDDMSTIVPLSEIDYIDVVEKTIIKSGI